MYKDGEPIFKNAKYDEIGRIVSYYKYSGEFKYSYEGDRILRGKVVYTIKNGLISTSGSGSDEEYNRAFTYINNKLSEVREWALLLFFCGTWETEWYKHFQIYITTELYGNLSVLLFSLY